jgi:hypothetical protein
MINVTVEINGEPVTIRIATNISVQRGITYGKGNQIYRVKDMLAKEEWELTHNFNHGANALARKMLVKPKSGKSKLKARGV